MNEPTPDTPQERDDKAEVIEAKRLAAELANDRRVVKFKWEVRTYAALGLFGIILICIEIF